MKEIKLTKGKISLVDEIDYNWLSKYNWQYNETNGYAFRLSKQEDDGSNYNRHKRRKIYMHKVINNTSNGFQTDHINGNRLDNRRVNLRTVTNRQNQQNRSIDCRNNSGYKGVHFFKRDSNWQAYITYNGKRKHLGYYSNSKLAGIVYNCVAKILFGEYANLNKIDYGV
jgi:hypothetical protein